MRGTTFGRGTERSRRRDLPFGTEGGSHNRKEQGSGGFPSTIPPESDGVRKNVRRLVRRSLRLREASAARLAWAQESAVRLREEGRFVTGTVYVKPRDAKVKGSKRPS